MYVKSLQKPRKNNQGKIFTASILWINFKITFVYVCVPVHYTHMCIVYVYTYVYMHAHMCTLCAYI